jgi:uncharacterized protein DUF3152
MCLMCSITYAATGAALLVANSGVATLVSSNQQKTTSELSSVQALPEVVAEIKAPTLKEPEWLKQQNAAEAAAVRASTPQGSVVTYSVITRGAITANLAEFKSQANATLNDQRGWAKMGVAFQEVVSGGMFTLVLSEASQLPTFSSGCGVEYSCRAGRYVIINQDRWLGATPSWNQAGGSLRDYRHMVVNHETGHWLGHDHQACGGAGQPAPVMQQQSISLQGCSFNAWPLASELWSTQLGIRL